MVSSMRSAVWLVMAFSLGLISVILLSYQTSFTGSPRVLASAQVPDVDPAVWRTPQPAILSPEQEVAGAIEDFRRAMVEAKPERIIESSSPELSFGHSNGFVQTREEFAETVRSGAEVFKRVDLTNKHLQVIGDTAIERHHFSADIVYEGKLQNFELEIVEVWKKTDKWRLLVRQAFRA